LLIAEEHVLKDVLAVGQVVQLVGRAISVNVASTFT
jgi:hypothetical protein